MLRPGRNLLYLRRTGPIRNAGFLAHVTNPIALSAIASVNLDHRILEAVESGRVNHHQLDKQPETAE